MKVTLIDTSVLCELLQVPGKSSPSGFDEAVKEMDERIALGERLAIPVTTVIETGNHIAQSQGDRYAIAKRFDHLLQKSLDGDAPWTLLRLPLDDDFVTAVRTGDSTDQDLKQLASMKVGAGDVAVLVQRDQLRRRSGFTEVTVWTKDEQLGGLAGAT